MSVAFLVLCLAALGTVAYATSACVGGLGLAARRFGWLEWMDPASRSRVLFAAGLAPMLLALSAVGVSVVGGATWLGDHCIAHGPHHPHLCLRHAFMPSSPLVWALALVTATRVTWRLGRLGHALHRAHRIGAELGGLSAGRDDGVTLVDAAEPRAFVLGLLRPRTYVSRGMADLLDARQLEALVAHEETHRRRRDPLQRAVLRLACAFHLPGVDRWLEREVTLAQEMSADAVAADTVRDPLRVAETLVRMARLRTPGRLPMAASGQEHLEARVHALVEGRGRRPGPSTTALTAAALAVATLLLAGAGPLHHGLETALGLLGH